MMINAQISIQIISAEGPPLVIALKDVHNFEMQAEEPFLFVQRMCKDPPPPTPTLHTHTHPFLHLCTFFTGRIHRNIC